MSAGKSISLEEVLKNPKLLKRFMKERASIGDADAFEITLENMVRKKAPGDQTSPAAHGDRSSDTQTRRDTDEDT
jgi:hypothetical protein